MNWKQILGDYFTFSRKERIAVILLITLIGLLMFIPRYFDTGNLAIGRSDSSWMSPVDTIIKQPGYKPREPSHYSSQPRPSFQGRGDLFAFDPNQLDEDGWKRLGLRESTVRIILNFRSRGGRFRKADDLRKIYGLFPDEFERIKPFARFAEKENPAGGDFSPGEKPHKEYFPKEKPYSPIELNSADSSALIALPGIGSKLAKRIIAFRDRLGGFYSETQLKEVYGLKDSVLQLIQGRLTINSSTIKRININTADLATLKSHPYFQSAATAIIAYRDSHGLFENLEAVMNVRAIQGLGVEKTRAYLEIK